MHTDQMAYLIDVAKTGSINTTAKRMFSSQQAVSESLKRLEAELNCTILNRSKRGVSLTEDGKYVLEHVIPIMEQYLDMQRHFQEKNVAPSGQLHVGVALFATCVFLPDLIFELYRQQTQIQLFTEELPINKMLDDVLAGTLDFGIAGFPEENRYSFDNMQQLYKDSLTFYPLYTDHIVCVMHQNNPLSTEKAITKEQLSQAHFTAYGKYSPEPASGHLIHISGNTAIHKKFMQEEHSVCLINTSAFKTLYSEKEFVAVPLATNQAMSMCLFTRKEYPATKEDIYQAFIETALNTAKQF